MNGPSVHLSWQELACHDGTPYPDVWREDRAPRLAREFEALRAMVGIPLFVLSAFRTPTWNKRVGGARSSQHLEGRALDLVAARGITVEQLHRFVVVRSKDPGSLIRGIGRYPGFVHVDVRPTSRIARW